MKHVRAHEIEGTRAPAPNTRTLKHLAAPWTIGSDQLWVGLSEVDPGSCSNRHSHPSEEAFFVVSGYGRIHVGDEVEPVGPGSLVVAPGGMEHQLENAGHEVFRVLCCATPAFTREVFDTAHRLDETKEGT